MSEEDFKSKLRGIETFLKDRKELNESEIKRFVNYLNKWKGKEKKDFFELLKSSSRSNNNNLKNNSKKILLSYDRKAFEKKFMDISFGKEIWKCTLQESKRSAYIIWLGFYIMFFSSVIGISISIVTLLLGFGVSFFILCNLFTIGPGLSIFITSIWPYIADRGHYLIIFEKGMSIRPNPYSRRHQLVLFTEIENIKRRVYRSDSKYNVLSNIHYQLIFTLTNMQSISLKGPDLGRTTFGGDANLDAAFRLIIKKLQEIGKEIEHPYDQNDD